MGIKGDGLISQENPVVIGECDETSTDYKGYGIYNVDGKFYFYDGIIEGKAKAVYDTITEREENTELNYNEDETVLTLTTELIDIAQIGDTTYKTIQEAINAIGVEQTTIKILRNVTFSINDTKIIIPNTKNVILDLNGYKITSSIEETLIQNEGMLEIIDSSEEKLGSLISNTERTITNVEGAKLIVSSGVIENRKETNIYNEGDLLIQGGIINSSCYSDAFGIYNCRTGKVSITEGIVSSTSSNFHAYGIYNSETGTVEVTGGEINSNGSFYTYGIYNDSTGIIEVIKGTVISNGSNNATYGIYNGKIGIIKVTGGMVSCSAYR